MSIILIPKSLRDKLGEEGAQALVDLFNQYSGNVKNDVISISAERFENRLSAEMGKVREWFGEVWARFEEVDRKFDEIDRRFEQIDQRFEQIDQRFEQIDRRFEQVEERISQLDRRLTEEIAQLRVSLIKWMFLFWIGQFGVIVGMMLTILR